MSIEDKMKNAKESHLFDELSEKEKFEAILEGKLKVRFIAELEKIKAEIQDFDLVSTNGNSAKKCIFINKRFVSKCHRQSYSRTERREQ